MTDKVKVLIVDDDINIIEMMLWALESENYEARGFTDPREVMTAIDTWHPDIAIIDLAMPEIDGAALSAFLRARCPKIRICLFSGYSETGEFQKVIKDIGADVFVRKPFDLTEMLKAIRGK